MITNMLKKILHTIPYTIAFGLLFSVAGYFIPQTYYQYVDQTVYYQIRSVDVEVAEVFACGIVDAYIDRVSMIDGQGNSIVNLTLIREDKAGAMDRVATVKRDITITKGEGVIITHWNVPCGTPPGRYYFDGVVKYEVRGVTKYEPFTTGVFTVGEDADDPSKGI